MASAVHLKDDFKNPWFLGILALVAVALGGTIWMAMIAGQTAPGLVTEDYYEKGQNYFENQPKEAQGPQWRLSLMAPAKPEAGQSQVYRLYVIMDNGKPASSAQVTLFAYRPSDANADFEVNMKQSDIGSFRADVSFPLKGTWDLIAQVEAEGKKHDVVQRIFVAD